MSKLTFKYIIIGDSGVGKTCLMTQFTAGKFREDHQLTIGVELGARTVRINDRKVKLQMWDTAGQESYRSVTRSYYRGAVAAVLVYDVTDRESFENVSKWSSEAITHGSKGLVLVLVGNKNDLEDSRVVSTDEGLRLAAEHAMLFWESSAKTGLNVDTLFVESAARVLDQMLANKLVSPKKGTSLQNQTKDKKCKC